MKEVAMMAVLFAVSVTPTPAHSIHRHRRDLDTYVQPPVYRWLCHPVTPLKHNRLFVPLVVRKAMIEARRRQELTDNAADRG